jgi:UDP-N-acetylmuramate--alanine ligase
MWAGFETGAAETGHGPADCGIHLVGIGGIGMSGIAEVLITLGYRVSGSDLHESDVTRRLATLGARVIEGHNGDNIAPETDVVVVSAAVAADNAEVQEARRRRIPVIQRAEMLAELMRLKCGVAVAGAHGKTTTTSLVASLMAAGGLDPTMVIGGKLRALGGTNARLGRSRYMVAEADESDGSFLLLRPVVAVVTNIDREHMTYYGTRDRLTGAFLEFINGVPFFGRAILCTDCREIEALLGRVRKRYTTYGISSTADFSPADVRYRGLQTSFDVIHRGAALGRVTIAMPGRHVVLNTLAAIAAAMEFGVPFERCVEALGQFEGVMRRFEVKGISGGVMVVDDYAHHPTEIRATLDAARKSFGHRTIAVFQPHRYTRTVDLFEEFTRAFGDADVVVLTDVYAAGETPVDSAHASRLAEAMARVHPGLVVYEPAGPGLVHAVTQLAGPGDLVLTLGAGDITRLGPELLKRFVD